jgi:hypothetical protein
MAVGSRWCRPCPIQLRLEGSGSIDRAMQVAESFTRAATASFEGSAFAAVPLG